jgi:hypothetical protein
MSIKVEMVHERSTAGTHFYREVDGRGERLEQRDAKIGSLYVRRSNFPGEPPGRITVSVDWS